MSLQTPLLIFMKLSSYSGDNMQSWQLPSSMCLGRSETFWIVLPLTIIDRQKLIVSKRLNFFSFFCSGFWYSRTKPIHIVLSCLFLSAWNFSHAIKIHVFTSNLAGIHYTLSGIHLFSISSYLLIFRCWGRFFVAFLPLLTLNLPISINSST